MANSFNVLRRLLPSSSLSNRRRRSRLAILQAAKEHVFYLEGIITKLLAEGHFRGDPESLEALRQTFYDSASALPSRSPELLSQCDSEPSSQELKISLDDLEEQDPTVFTGVREPSVNVAIAADSVPSSPTLCQAWLSNRAAEAAVTLSPTVRSLMESFYDNVPTTAHENSLVQLVPDVVAYKAVPPSYSDNDYLVPTLQLCGELIPIDDGNAAAASPEDPFLGSFNTAPERSPTSDNEQDAFQLPDQWILNTCVKLVLNSDD
uniref:BHLH domain-containing protein n=1 Tax=Amblyomma triste TaxID=251400 RepID=A0A023GAQ7_AMBTT